MLIGFFLFVVYLGVLANGKQQMDDLTRVAAQNAVLHDQWSDAYSSSSRESQQQAVDDTALECPSGWLSLNGSRWQPGGSVTVSANCSIETGGIFPGAPTTIRVSSRSTAPISRFHAATS